MPLFGWCIKRIISLTTHHYINQTTDKEGNEKMAKLTNELIDATTKHNGRFFLPYQLHYSEAQLVASYPEITQFFEAKKKYDPSLRLTNTFYNKYASSISDLNTTQ
jgi:hypothetical protein